MSPWTETIETHRTDIAWLVTLWLAIHGDDPVPERVEISETAAVLAAALSAHLAEASHRPPLTGGEGITVEVHAKMILGPGECECFGQIAPVITVNGSSVVWDPLLKKWVTIPVKVNACVCTPPGIDRLP